jgi:hypothetical protein
VCVLRRSAIAVAVLAACSCASRKSCKTDADCGNSAVCIELGERPGDRVRRCRATCTTESDCLLAAGFGKQCRALADTASGPATLELRQRYVAPNVSYTTRGTIRICRGAKEVIH